jgi:hypothetical protein
VVARALRSPTLADPNFSAGVMPSPQCYLLFLHEQIKDIIIIIIIAGSGFTSVGVSPAYS